MVIMAKTISVSAIVPGSRKYCVDNWALGILRAHEKNILW